MDEDPLAYEEIPVAPVWVPAPSAPPAPSAMEITISQCLTDLETRAVQQKHCGRTQITIDMNQAPYYGRQAEIIEKYKKRNPDHRLLQDPVERVLVISWTLTPKQLEILRKVNESKCFRCGRNSHWIADCQASTDVHGNRL